MSRFERSHEFNDGFGLYFDSARNGKVINVVDDSLFVAGLEVGEELRDGCSARRCEQSTGVTMGVVGVIAVGMHCRNFGQDTCAMTGQDPDSMGRTIDQRAFDLEYTE